jgi:hypothetical protein
MSWSVLEVFSFNIRRRIPSHSSSPVVFLPCSFTQLDFTLVPAETGHAQFENRPRCGMLRNLPLDATGDDYVKALRLQRAKKP